MRLIQSTVLTWGRMALMVITLCPLVATNAFGDLILSTDVFDTPLKVTANGESETFTINITSNGSNPQTMSGWQFDLFIMPLTGVGTVEFDIPVSTTAPSNYVFGAATNISISSETTSEFIAQDSVAIANSVLVPDSGKNLFDASVTAPTGTTGTFGVFVRQGQFNTLWTDDVLVNGSPSELSFQNISFGTGSIQIGTISVVPEPSAFLMVGFVALACGRFCPRARQHDLGADE